MSANGTYCNDLSDGTGGCYATGFAAAGVSVLFFGSNFVPVKRFNTGDGMFFQWVLCCSIWCVGGFFWATGNVMVVPIVKMIGLGLGLLIWGTSNLIFGWASGKFGFFGIKKQTVPDEPLNYVGVAFALLSVIIFVFVKPEEFSESKQADHHHDDESHLLSLNGDENGTIWVDKLSMTQKRILGVVGSIVSGVFYGINFDPPQYLIDSGKYSSLGIDYAFSHFCGILLTSTGYFLLYCAAKKSKPEVYPEAILPGFISGAMWAIAQCGWFIANSKLQLVVTFPIISTGPGLVGALWGIFLFKEIKGRRNFLFVAAAFVIEFAAIALITVSGIHSSKSS